MTGQWGKGGISSMLNDYDITMINNEMLADIYNNFTDIQEQNKYDSNNHSNYENYILPGVKNEERGTTINI